MYSNVAQDAKASIWKSLEKNALKMQQRRLQDLFAENPLRVKENSIMVGNIYLDYSKNFLNEQIRQDLIALARVSELTTAISALALGECVNTTEKRPALHMDLRSSNKASQFYPEIHTQKEKMYRFVRLLQQKEWMGVSSLAITDVVNIGIGGSDLGPMMAVEALKAYQKSDLRIHFVSNIDPIGIEGLLSTLNPATTLFIVSSKSFSTPETLTNAIYAKAWLNEKLNTQNINQHFIAITANETKAMNFGIAQENILNFWDWVGGRFSIWSVIGFPLALSIGIEHFEEFLRGAEQMDIHFINSDFSENMPVLLALLGIWYVNFWHAKTLAILPYSENLKRFPDYLQQLDMESNGKSNQHTGHRVNYATGPIIWGQVGTNGQHAFYQLLHQGTHFVPVDFIVPLQSNAKTKTQHQQLVANCFAQAQALMQGNDVYENDHEYMPGNKPSNMILLSKISPETLGQLIALYEHKIFVQGVIWQINSFDQPGVELGKNLAKNLLQYCETGRGQMEVDPSTYSLIQKLQALR